MLNKEKMQTSFEAMSTVTMGYPSVPNVMSDSSFLQQQSRSHEFHPASDNNGRHVKYIPPGIPGKPDVQACPYILQEQSDGQSTLKELSNHLKLGQSMFDALKGKISLGAKIVTKGGRENLFKQLFPADNPQERLIKISSCYLSTTTGPIVGVLFISTLKFAFCSECPLIFTSPSGGSCSAYYLVSVPLKKVKCVNPYEAVGKQGEKYVQIQTVDGHEFWFMGFANFHKALRYMQQVMKNAKAQY